MNFINIQKSIDEIYHINRMKNKNHIIISIDTLDKIHHKISQQIKRKLPQQIRKF